MQDLFNFGLLVKEKKKINTEFRIVANSFSYVNIYLHFSNVKLLYALKFKTRIRVAKKRKK